MSAAAGALVTARSTRARRRAVVFAGRVALLVGIVALRQAAAQLRFADPGVIASPLAIWNHLAV